MRVIIFFVISCLITINIFAQTREELEKQRAELKREIDETQKLLSSNKTVTKQNLTTLTLYTTKYNLQGRVLENIGKDLRILDNNIYSIQKDVNRYDRLLDTLKQEYAKSMVYSYKNRGNYEFINFIFSADNFNDAFKRISYLKSYRTYREMQGQNILRTQELRRKRLQDLGASKQTKSVTLGIQSKELTILEQQKEEQDKIVAQLKKEGNGLNARIAAKQKQIAKVNNAIRSAIAKAIKEDNDRIAAAERVERKRRDDLAKELKKKKLEDAGSVKIATGKTVNSDIKSATIPTRKPTVAVKEPEIVILTNENIALNANFEKNRGVLPWPVDNPAIINHFGKYYLGSGKTTGINDAVTIAAPIGSAVKAVFDGIVILTTEIEDGKYMVTIKHGNYYTSYVNLSNVSVKYNQEVKTGQSIGKVSTNMDNIGSIDFKTAKGYTDLDPEKWLRHR